MIFSQDVCLQFCPTLGHVKVVPIWSAGACSQPAARLAKWFVKHGALYVCVDIEPSNEVAQRFYARHGAEDLKPHWMVWKDVRTVLGKAR